MSSSDAQPFAVLSMHCGGTQPLRHAGEKPRSVTSDRTEDTDRPLANARQGGTRDLRDRGDVAVSFRSRPRNPAYGRQGRARRGGEAEHRAHAAARHRAPRQAVTTAVLAAALPSPAPASAPPTPTPDLPRRSQRPRANAPTATLCLINAERRARGLAPLTANARLARAAQGHAADMVARDYFSHFSPSGSSFTDRLRRVGYARQCLGGRGDARLGQPHPALAGVARGRLDAESAAPGDPAQPGLSRGGHRHRGRLAERRGRERHVRRRVRPPTLLSGFGPLHRLSAREPEDPGPARHVRRARRRCARAHGARGACPPHPRARRLCAHRDAGLRGDGAVRARGGESTDVVQKEMYTLDEGPSESLTLRPEGTAPVCRAYLEHGMHKLPQPVKLWYLSSFFRRERPQAGRFRQFWQIGAEAIGSADPGVDAELILLLAELLEAVGARGLRLRLSSLGTPATREQYRARPPGLPARARGRAVGGGARPHRPQPAARVRRRPSRHAPGDGGRAAAARPAQRRGRVSTSRPSARCSTAPASPTRSTRRSCAGSTTTRARCSSSPPTRSAPRAASAAAGATTG